jgi:uncharacterized membrane protein
MNKGTKSLPLERIYSYILSVGGVLGLIAMTWQASERVHILKYPETTLSCNLNPIVDCGGVLGNKLAAVFGFPNAFLGIVFFTILATCGLLLLSGGKFVGWFRHFVLGVSVILLLFSLWFFGVSLYSIGKICIFCAVGWVVSIPMFWYGLLYYLQNSSRRIKARCAKFIEFGNRHHIDVVLAVYATMLVLFLFRFREYYF